MAKSTIKPSSAIADGISDFKERANAISQDMTEETKKEEVKAEKLAKYISVYKKENPNSRIVVVAHWGYEYMDKPSGKQEQEATLLANSGVDLIVGHHPHVIQTVDTIGNCTVIYSLGNFVFDSKREEGQKGQMAKVTFNKKGTKIKLYDVDIVKCRPEIKNR